MVSLLLLEVPLIAAGEIYHDMLSYNSSFVVIILTPYADIQKSKPQRSMKEDASFSETSVEPAPLVVNLTDEEIFIPVQLQKRRYFGFLVCIIAALSTASVVVFAMSLGKFISLLVSSSFPRIPK